MQWDLGAVLHLQPVSELAGHGRVDQLAEGAPRRAMLTAASLARVWQQVIVGETAYSVRNRKCRAGRIARSHDHGTAACRGAVAVEVNVAVCQIDPGPAVFA